MRIYYIFIPVLLFVLACGDDTQPTEVGCCVALPGQDQSICDPLEALGEDRCNMINGGTSCSWSTAVECNMSMDGGAAQDASQDRDAGQQGEDAGQDRDAGQPEPDAGVALGCCQPSTSAADPAVCAAAEALGADRCNALDTCMWSTSDPDCREEVELGCCQPSTSAGDPAVCAAVEALGADRCNALDTCMWSTSDPECRPDEEQPCCIAIGDEPQSYCDMIEPFGVDRCNRVLGGTTCMWSAAPACR